MPGFLNPRGGVTSGGRQGTGFAGNGPSVVRDASVAGMGAAILMFFAVDFHVSLWLHVGSCGLS